MKKRELSTLLLGTIFTFVLLSAETKFNLSFVETLTSITAAELQSELYFLASDEMQGREINTPFNDITALYLAHRFQLMGLQPVQENTYFQPFKLVSSKLDKRNRLKIRYTNSSLSVNGVLKKDYFPSPLSAKGSVTAPLIFAGYGITAPEDDYDDYRELSASKKIAVIIRHEPRTTNLNGPLNKLLNSNHSENLKKNPKCPKPWSCRSDSCP